MTEVSLELSSLENPPLSSTGSPSIVYPQNTTSYVLENRTLTTFFVAAVPENYNNGLCNLRAFENDCLATNNYCPNRDLKLYHEEGQQILNYTLSNFNISLDGTRIDICARCTSLYKCFPPVYLSVKGEREKRCTYVILLYCRSSCYINRHYISKTTV